MLPFNKMALCNFVLSKKNACAQSISKIRLVSKQALPKMSALAYVVIKIPTGQTKSYAPIDKGDDFVEILVRSNCEDAVAKYLIGLKINDTVSIECILQDVQYVPNKYNNILLISGDLGVAPLFQILKEGLSNPKDKTNFIFLVGLSDENENILKSELEALSSQYGSSGRFKYRTRVFPQIVSENPDSIGMVESYFLSKYFRDHSIDFIYVAGPKKALDFIAGAPQSDGKQGPLKGILADFGFEEKKVYKISV